MTAGHWEFTQCPGDSAPEVRKVSDFLSRGRLNLIEMNTLNRSPRSGTLGAP
jgi:hypothetical protein